MRSVDAFDVHKEIGERRLRARARQPKGIAACAYIHPIGEVGQ